MPRRSNRTLRWGLAVVLAMVIAGCGSSSPVAFEETAIDVCEQAMQVQHVAAGDLDGDGAPELVVSCRALAEGWDPGAVEVYSGTSDEGFSLQASHGFATAPRATTLADMDADGSLDLVVTVSGPEERRLSVLGAHGDGSFSELVEHVTPSDLQATTTHDMTGNGMQDVLVPGSNRILTNEGSPGQPGPFSEDGLVAMDVARDLNRADVDGDGQPDTAHIDGVAGAVLVHPNGGTSPIEVAVPEDAAELHVVRAGGDLDGDGVLDLLVSTQTAPLESEVRTLVSGDDDTWAVSGPIDGLSGQTPAQLLTVDVTRDGALDVIRVPVAEPDRDDYQLTMLPGSGDGTFGEPAEIDVEGFPYRALVADVSGDGSEDLVFIREGEPRNELVLLVVEGQDGTQSAAGR